MYAEISKEFTFEAAHMLPHHNGKCRNLHGHSYKAVIYLAGPIQEEHPENPESGMIVDYGDVSAIWKEHLEPYLDHVFLNETLSIYTTAENVAWWILKRFLEVDERLGTVINSVEVQETATSSATVCVEAHYADEDGFDFVHDV